MEYKIDPYQKVFTKVLNFVSYKPRAEAEVFERLKSYLAKENITQNEKDLLQEKIIIQLKQDGYIDDKKTLKLYVDNFSTSRKPKSIRRFKQDLKRKGISQTDIEEGSLALPENLEYDLALVDARKKIRKYGKDSGFILKSKLTSYLYSKGYASETIKSVVDTLLQLQ